MTKEWNEAEARFKDTALPTDSDDRKGLPLASGCLDYFPAALAEVARLSKYGNDKHNPGEELHHARGKSTDHADCIMRHLVERGVMDPTGFSHTVMVAWRALALLQEELEAAGAPLARGARLDEPEPKKCLKLYNTGEVDVSGGDVCRMQAECPQPFGHEGKCGRPTG